MLNQIMAMYYFYDDKVGTGIKTYKWLEGKIIELLSRMRRDRNEVCQSAYIRDLAQGKAYHLPAAVGLEMDTKGGKDSKGGKGGGGKNTKGDPKGGKDPKGKTKGDKNGGKGGKNGWQNKGGKGDPGQHNNAPQLFNQQSPNQPSTSPGTQPPQKDLNNPNRPTTPCYAFSRDQCTPKEKDCPHKRAHVTLNKEQKEKRDEYEKRTLAAGKTLGYIVNNNPAVPGPKATAKPKANAPAAVAVQRPSIAFCRSYSRTGQCLLGGAEGGCTLLHEDKP